MLECCNRKYLQALPVQVIFAMITQHTLQVRNYIVYGDEKTLSTSSVTTVNVGPFFHSGYEVKFWVNTYPWKTLCKNTKVCTKLCVFLILMRCPTQTTTHGYQSTFSRSPPTQMRLELSLEGGYFDFRPPKRVFFFFETPDFSKPERLFFGKNI